MSHLTLQQLKEEAKKFSVLESQHREKSLYGIDNGKSIGTYIEQKFQSYLQDVGYQLNMGNSARGIDIPELNVDIKATSIRQPQSSCPFRSARQKIYGLGYSILLFVYSKDNNLNNRTSTLTIHRTIFIDADRTADYQLTSIVRQTIENNGNVDDLVACFLDRNLPVDEILARRLAEEVMSDIPKQGLLTISNALQWRLQYSRIIELSDKEVGVECLHAEIS